MVLCRWCTSVDTSRRVHANRCTNNEISRWNQERLKWQHSAPSPLFPPSLPPSIPPLCSSFLATWGQSENGGSMLLRFMNETGGGGEREVGGGRRDREGEGRGWDGESTHTCRVLLSQLPRSLDGRQRQDGHVTREWPQNPQTEKKKEEETRKCFIKSTILSINETEDIYSKYKSKHLPIWKTKNKCRE